MEFRATDGGRKEAGFKGTAPGDCVTRAIAVVTGKPYKEVYQDLNVMANRAIARTGVPKEVTRRYMADLGFTWTPTMRIGQGCKVHMRAEELPAGRLVIQLSRHVTAVIDGVVFDLYDPTRDGTRCVYGYWKREVK